MSPFLELAVRAAIAGFVTVIVQRAGNDVYNSAKRFFDDDDSDVASDSEGKLSSSDLQDLQDLMNELHTVGHDAMLSISLEISIASMPMEINAMFWDGSSFKFILDDYKGELRNDKPHGIGVYKAEDSEDLGSYEGEWRFGKPHGEGVCTYSNGVRYEGVCRDGKPHGEGVCTYPEDVSESGAQYDGAWHDGKPHGKGIFTNGNGDRYDGEWHDGKPHGEGVFSGKLRDHEDIWYVGEWFDGYPHGKGFFMSPDGRSIAGYWHNGKLVDVRQVDGKLVDVKLENIIDTVDKLLKAGYFDN